MDSYVCLDLETTGLTPKTDRILEIGAVKVINGKAVAEYQTLIDPKMQIPGRITDLTGITQEMVQGMPKEKEAVEGLIDFCEDLPLLGHNLIFDYSFVKHSAVNHDMVFEKQGADTLKIARIVLPDLESRALQALRKYYDIPQEKAHRALGDANTTYLLYERLKEEFKEKCPDAFKTMELCYKAKKQGPITKAQKGYLQDLLKYHRIDLDREMDSLTKNEASRLIDNILASYGRINR